jgi:hypothetical protein
LPPSNDEAIEYQLAFPLFRAVHVTPESAEVWIAPPNAPATSLVPSDEEAELYQFWIPLFCGTQVAPESPDV